MDTLYRFHEVRFSESKLILIKDEFKVLSNTEHGVWIDVYGHKRFVNLGSRKRYACPTVEEALESYQARKKRQIRILTRQLKQAEAALTLTPDNDSAYYGLGL